MIIKKCDAIAMSLNQLLKYDWVRFRSKHVRLFDSAEYTIFFQKHTHLSCFAWICWGYDCGFGTHIHINDDFATGQYHDSLCKNEVNSSKLLGTFSAVKVVNKSSSTVESNIPLMKNIIRNRSVRTLGHKNNSFEGIITLHWLYF